jgi:hypothetical protein
MYLPMSTRPNRADAVGENGAILEGKFSMVITSPMLSAIAASVVVSGKEVGGAEQVGGG